MTADSATDDKEEMMHRFNEFSKYGRKFEKAVETVLAGGVKETRFAPSGRRLLTVVGSLGEEFIDPQRPYCSCSNFHFMVSSGKEETCYHLLSFAIASRAGRIDVTNFSDDEYQPLIKAIVTDVFGMMSRS